MTWLNTETAGAKEKKDESLLLMVRLSKPRIKRRSKDNPNCKIELIANIQFSGAEMDLLQQAIEKTSP